MKFFKTRIGTILITALISTLIFGGLTLAATFPKTLSGQGNVIAGNPDIAFFSDAACTTPLTQPIVIPDVIQGEVANSVPFYIKNVGNKTFSTVTFSNDLASGVGTLTGSQNNFVLAKGASVATGLTITASASGTTGPYTFTATFTGTY